MGVAHHFSFRARTVVDIVYLQLDQWKYLLDFYPKSAKIVQKKVENVYLAIWIFTELLFSIIVKVVWFVSYYAMLVLKLNYY